jgi:voltage-gated potassium channel
VDYVARLRLSIGKARFVRTHKLELLMVLLRLLRIFLLLRRSLASVSTEKIAGSIVSLVVAAVFVSAFFMWRVEYNAPGATITTFRYALWWAIVTTTTVGYGDYTPVTLAGRVIATAVMIRGRRTDRHDQRHRGSLVRQAARAGHRDRRPRIGGY